MPPYTTTNEVTRSSRSCNFTLGDGVNDGVGVAKPAGRLLMALTVYTKSRARFRLHP